MKVCLCCVGKPRGELAAVIADYEGRIGHYFSFEAIEVREATGKSVSADQAVELEGERLLARLPDHYELVALHRKGKAWGSPEIAHFLESAGIDSVAGVAFVIGGAFGLSQEVLARASRKLSLSAATLPHEIARLVLAEQIYRAGTMIRGEPYHKGDPLR